MKPNAQIGRSTCGVAYCGFRIKPGVVLPSARKLSRYRAGVKRLLRFERDDAGECGDREAQLQRAHDVLLASLAHSQSQGFRQRLWCETREYASC